MNYSAVSTRVFVVLVMLIAGCKRLQPTRKSASSSLPTQAQTSLSWPISSQPASGLAGYLPGVVPPFVAGALEVNRGFVRRSYVHNNIRIDVTIAQRDSGNEQFYNEWIQMIKGYPPVPIDVPPDTGSGFYDCAGSRDKETCSVHIQLRKGFHIELISNGKATRSDLEAVLRGLPLRALAQPSS